MAKTDIDQKKILRNLREELDQKKADEYVPKNYSTALFSNNVFNLSDLEMDPIDPTHFYKKSFATKHLYSFDKPLIVPTVRKIDPFKEVSLFLPPTLEEEPLVNGDFLLGYYLGKAFIVPNLIETLKAGVEKSIKSFHAGISSDGINRGIWYYILAYNKLHPKAPILWEFYGCDKRTIPEYKTKYLNGVSKKCDVHSYNSIRSINIQVPEKLGLVDLFIDDVKPKSVAQLTLQLILAGGLVKDTGFSFIRLPLNWLSHFTPIVNLLIYCISTYQVVKIFKTPWGEKPKLYLLLAKPNHKAIYPAVLTGLAKYAEASEQNPKLNLYNKMIFHVEDLNTNNSTDSKTDVDDANNTSTEEIADSIANLLPEAYMTGLIERISTTYKKLMSDTSEFTIQEATPYWMDNIQS